MKQILKLYKTPALLFFLATQVAVYFACAAYAEEGVQYGSSGEYGAMVESSDTSKPLAPYDIERAIEELFAPIDFHQVMMIQSDILQQKPEDQESLQKLFDARMNELINSDASLNGPVDFERIASTSSPELLKSQIDTLNLGSSATVEELRERDKLVGIISYIKDPNLRYELLDYLQEKEKDAG